MKLDVTQSLRSFTGEELKRQIFQPADMIDDDGNPLFKTEDVPLTIRDVLLKSLNAEADGYEGASKQYVLAISVATNDVVNFTTDDVQLLKLLLPKEWRPVVVVQIIAMLDDGLELPLPPSEEKETDTRSNNGWVEVPDGT